MNKFDQISDEELVACTFAYLREKYGVHQQTVMNLVRARKLAERRAEHRSHRISEAAAQRRSLIQYSDAELTPEPGECLTARAQRLGVTRHVLRYELDARGIPYTRIGTLREIDDVELTQTPLSVLARRYGVHVTTVSRERARRARERVSS